MHNINSPKVYDICNALREVERLFPFDRYIGEVDRTYVAFQIIQYVSKGGRILDFGCGPGDFTAMLSFLGFECVGWDDLLDPWHLQDDNRSRIQQFLASVGVRFVLLDGASALPDDTGFDAVVLSDVIEHFHDSPQNTIIELVKRLRPKGYLFMTTPNAVSLRKRLDVIRGRTNYLPLEAFYFCPPPWRGHVREYTLHELVSIAHWARLKVIHADWYDAFVQAKVRNKMLLRFYLSLTALIRSLKDSLFLVAQKPSGWQDEIRWRLPKLVSAKSGHNAIPNTMLNDQGPTLC